MTLTASELPSGTKKQLLEKVREQIGEMRYRDLLNSLGEDGIIDALLNVGTATKAAPPGKTTGKRVTGFLSSAIIVIAAVAMFLGFLWAVENFESWYGKVLAGVLLVPFLLYISGFRIPEGVLLIVLATLAILVSAVLIVWGLIQGLTQPN